MQCDRRLWLGWHEPEVAVEAAPGSILAVGHEVGEHAHQLFPGGVLVGGGPREFAQAVAQTQELLADRAVGAIFEPAFAFNDVWVRVDILERAAHGGWIINEVKSSTRVKPENIHDLAIQRYVVEGCGLTVEGTNLIHVDTSYVCDLAGLDWTKYFRKVDVTAQVLAALADTPGRVASFHEVLAGEAAPERRPSTHCFKPFECEFWERCTKDKPADWIWHLPRLSAERFAALDAMGIESISALPADFPLNGEQRRVAKAFRTNGIVVQPSIAAVLSHRDGPNGYLDFETFSPAIPLYAGTRPYQRIAAQWSLHVENENGDLEHHEFLAGLAEDPRRGFCESLLAAVGTTDPIYVYSPFESSTLDELARQFDDLADAIQAVRRRLVDLLPVVRTSVDHAAFKGSNSIKAVGPVLARISYDALTGVAEGGNAAAALYRLATDQLQADETRDGLRAELLSYCSLDTEALARTRMALVALALGLPGSPPEEMA
jgi:hypothetical protein